MVLRHQLTAYSPVAIAPLTAAIARRATAPTREIESAAATIAATYDADDVLLVDSGRSALQLALHVALLAHGAGSLVCLPAFQCFEVASAAIGAGCRVGFYDVDPGTLCPDRASLEEQLRGGARIVVIAPLYGYPVDWSAIEALAQRHGASVIEDAAQAHGARWHDRRLGSLGSLAVLSFGRGKGWTGGGGGALLVRGAHAHALVELRAALPAMPAAREARVIAATVAQWIGGRPSVYGIPAAVPALGLGSTRYHAPTTPTAASAFSAAMLRRTREPSEREAEARRANAARWMAELPDELRRAIPPVVVGGSAGYLRMPVVVPPGATSLFTTPAARRAGVAPSYPLALPELGALAPFVAVPGRRHAGAETLARRLFTLPTHSLVSESDRTHILALATAGVARREREADSGAVQSVP